MNDPPRFAVARRATPYQARYASADKPRHTGTITLG